jgi:hypothetical protein
LLPSGKLPALKELILADDLLGKSIGAVYSTLQTLGSEIKRIDKEIELLAGEDEYQVAAQDLALECQAGFDLFADHSLSFSSGGVAANCQLHGSKPDNRGSFKSQ